jgi:hypothetical protein
MITLSERTFLQPTLSLYLGGTGILVGDRMLSLMEGLGAEERLAMEAFFIDSQQPAIVDHARSRHYCYQNISQFRDPTYRRFSQRRFPANLGITPVVNSCEGCGVTRIFGTASLVTCRDNFASLLQQASGRLRKNRKESTQPMQVFLTASSCGGTGAGMIIDAAALVRHFFRERGETPRIFLFLIGPTVFLEDPTIELREDQRARMRASSYALLKELNHFAQGKPFLSEYRLRDETIRIGNTADDDRLFEWVYFIDGRGEQTGSTRTLAEVAWMIAEAQVHLSVTEVGRKVAESMPNQREERLREYAFHFTHSDQRERLTETERRQMQTASRRTFLASFSVRNTRFPAEEIKTWFRWGWVREALQKILRRGSDGGRSQVEQFDALLGYDGENVLSEGLLADLGLTREQLAFRVREDALQDQALLKALSLGLDPDAAVTAAEEFLNLATWMVEDMKKESSLIAGLEASAATGPARTCAEALAIAFPKWTNFWIDGLARNGRIAERLWEVAGARSTGRGCRFLDGFLAHAADVLSRLAQEGKRRPKLDELEENIADVRRNLRAISKASERENGKGLSWRKILVLLHVEPKVSHDLQRRTKGLLTQVNNLRNKVLVQRSTRIADLLAPAAWEKAAQRLKQWRDTVLAPVITAGSNALTLAENEWKLAHRALRTHQGVNARGRWLAHSTMQVADNALLDTFAASIGGRVSVEDLILQPLQADGISRERRRLTLRSLASFGRQAVVDVLFDQVKDATGAVLAFLDNGWMLPEVASRLDTSAAQTLDIGAEPLASFSRAAIGQPLQSHLLAPEGVPLPEPFGQELGTMNRIASRDPLQFGVVSFVFGIPPNSLHGMADLFWQYAVHVGDQERYAGELDRYPLHVFRDAAESFNEPYSPIGFQLDDSFVQTLIDVAKEIWGENGVKLQIRQFDPQSDEHRRDWNRVIELAETVLHHLILAPDEAEALFRDGRFAAFESLYRLRKHDTRDPKVARDAAGMHGGNGNGSGKAPHGDPVRPAFNSSPVQSPDVQR